MSPVRNLINERVVGFLSQLLSLGNSYYCFLNLKSTPSKTFKIGSLYFLNGRNKSALQIRCPEFLNKSFKQECKKCAGFDFDDKGSNCDANFEHESSETITNS